ncbi:MAG: aminotransferase class I/II-fold pyridoxal phosphate-dependent enzyme [Synergistales bacterium]|nr:aminotransferase class I/II-fold pyridoxal phosphate-dependent enzyme [Synergistales bacterium]
MKIRPFELERYFAKYEFSVKYVMSASDCETVTVAELMAMAGDEEMETWSRLRLHYTEPKGHPDLLKAISKTYQGISPENLITVVPEEGIFLAMNALLEPGDNVVALFPLYQSLLEIPRSIGCSISDWPIVLDGDSWRLDMDLLESLIRPDTKLLAINFPHNPTGFHPTEREFRKILEIAAKNGIWVFSDEMYRGLEPSPGTRLPSAAEVYPKAISLSGLSKSYGLPGLRMGWLACTDSDMMKEISGLRDYTTICGSAPSEALSILALKCGDKLIGRCQDIVEKNTAVASEFFERHQDLFGWIPPMAGSIAFPELRENTPADELFTDVLDRKNLMILPGSVFGAQGNHFRIGLGREDFPECCRILEEYLDER